jgi:hypothetical protein
MSLNNDNDLTSEAATELGQAIYELVTQMIDPEEFKARFLAARIYTLCPVRPGLFVMSRPGGEAIVPVWSTVRALRRVMGNYDWCARTGRDLVDHLPAGARVLIDPGMSHSMTLPDSAGNHCAS